jgi:hypothetical protein
MTVATNSAKTGARAEMTWTTFVGASVGVLRAAGLADESLDVSEFFGLSGRAWHMVMDETCCPSCPTMYEWAREHVLAFERAGVFAEVHQAMPDQPRYQAARRRAVGHIKEALDRGVGVVLFGVDAPEFGVVYGYDDDDGVFVTDGVGRFNTGNSTPILYENVGRSCDVPELHYVVPVERIAVDAGQVHRAVLAGYVEQLRGRVQALPPKYTAGLAAYDTWVRALESGQYVPFGVRYNTVLLADARGHGVNYLERVAAAGLDSTGVAAAARATAEVYQRMVKVIEMDGPNAPAHLGLPVTAAQAKALVPLMREAKAAEARQVGLAEKALKG